MIVLLFEIGRGVRSLPPLSCVKLASEFASNIWICHIAIVQIVCIQCKFRSSPNDPLIDSRHLVVKTLQPRTFTYVLAMTFEPAEFAFLLHLSLDVGIDVGHLSGRGKTLIPDKRMR